MERLSFFVGPNGCGKTQNLLSIYKNNNLFKNVASITNTSFSRFPSSKKNRPVLRISPYGVKKVTENNLVNFFGSEGRDTFDIADLLYKIGFNSEIELVAYLNVFDKIKLNSIIKNKKDLDALLYFFEVKSDGFLIKSKLTNDQDSYIKSFRGFNRVFFKYIKTLKKYKFISDYYITFNHKNRGVQKFSDLSSGEQTLICTFLFIRSNIKFLDAILIDEPENSLHPQWQRQYVEFLHMAIGYSEVNIFLATHSPIIVSGAVENYSNDLGIYSVCGNNLKKINLNRDHDSEGVEEILLKIFDTITPVSGYLAEIISDLTWDVQEGKLGKEDAIRKLEILRSKSYSVSQENFIMACEKIIEEIK